MIIKLDAADYEKCNNIWNMKKNAYNIDMAKRFYAQLLSGNRIIFIYTENDKFIGEGSLVLDENGDSDYTIPHQRIYLSRMVVKKKCQNRGIGGKMLRFLIDYARGLGYIEMSVGVDVNNIRARWLYEKNGFTNIVFVGEDSGGKYVKLVKKL